MRSGGINYGTTCTRTLSNLDKCRVELVTELIEGRIALSHVIECRAIAARKVYRFPLWRLITLYFLHLHQLHNAWLSYKRRLPETQH